MTAQWFSAKGDGTCLYPSTQESEAGELLCIGTSLVYQGIPSQPGLCSKTVSQTPNKTQSRMGLSKHKV